MKIGTYVCDIDDEMCNDPAIVVHNDSDYPQINQIKRTDGHLSLRKDSELKDGFYFWKSYHLGGGIANHIFSSGIKESK